MEPDSDLIAPRLAALRRRPFAELLRLPDHAEEDVRTSSGPVTVVTWKDLLSDCEVRIVVQAVLKGPLASHRVIDLCGFRIDADGMSCGLDDGDLVEFL